MYVPCHPAARPQDPGDMKARPTGLIEDRSAFPYGLCYCGN